MQRSEALRETARNLEAYQAWQKATRWESFDSDLLYRSKVVPDGIGYNTSVWLNAFQHSDAKLITTRGRYGNAGYSITFFIRIIYSPPSYEPQKKQMSKDLSVQCSVDQLDDGDWISRDYSYSIIGQIPEFPGGLIKRD